ncbi:MAG: hypothetical protein V1648_05345 [Candidatus Aenigmatarchaeota archaeon]
MNKAASALKYPKFMLLAATFIAAYLLFSFRDFTPFESIILYLGYAGSFLSGIAYSYGFTSGFSTAALLVIAKDYNIFIAGFVAGLGALVGDLLIFKFIRHSLEDEVDRLGKTGFVRRISSGMPCSVKKYLLSAIAVFVIASPLPDEIGVVLFAACTKINVRKFSEISYLLNTAGIFVILFAGILL